MGKFNKNPKSLPDDSAEMQMRPGKSVEKTNKMYLCMCVCVCVCVFQEEIRRDISSGSRISPVRAGRDSLKATRLRSLQPYPFAPTQSLLCIRS